MEIRIDVEVAHPVPVVFAAYRDRLPELVPYLPDIRSIEVVSREDSEGETRFVNLWIGGGDIPAVARAFLKESMLRWTDHALWSEAKRSVVWRTEVHALPGAIRSSGENFYKETPAGTRLEIRGELVCDPSKVPGLPRFLAGSVQSGVEKFFVGKVVHSTKSIARGMTKLLKG